MVAYIVVLVLALMLQLLFTALYWKWIPSWVKNPYGRLAQLDAWSQILLLFISIVFFAIGTRWTIEEKRFVITICLSPVVLLGIFRLILLKKAVDSSAKEEGDRK